MENKGTVDSGQLAKRNGAMRLVKRGALATLAAAAFALFAGGIADTFRQTRAEEVQIGAVVGSGFVQITDGACSAANTANQPAYDAVNNVLDINVMPGALASNCFGVTVTTDNTLGYSMIIAGPTTGNLTLAGQSITQKDGSLENPTVFANQTTGGAWGFAIPNNQIQNGNWGFEDSYSVMARDNTTNTALYAPVPTTPTTIDTVPTISGTQSFDYDVFFATSAGAYAPTGTYTGTVTISAFGNAAVPPVELQTGYDMQLIGKTDSNGATYVCPTTRTRVRDARDNATYWIRKIPGTKAGGGDLCWMETSLAYAGGGDNTYGDTMPMLTLGSTTADFTYTEARYYISPNSNRTTGTEDPSTSVDGGITNPQYGYYYNWCAALNSQPAACQGSAATQPNQSKNDGTNVYNVCPAGWRLPTGGAGGEFESLNNTINGGSTTSPSGLFTNGLFMYDGYWSNGSFFLQGSNGYYWSSTVAYAAYASSLIFGKSNVRPTTNDNKWDGYAVRCVAP